MVKDNPWYMPRNPGAITAEPWLHPEAVNYLESIVEKDWHVLEHGSGGSTLWFAERVEQVVSIENDTDWRMKIRELAPSNVILLESIPNKVALRYDLFMIDGKPIDDRGICLDLAHNFVKPGGWIVLDNANHEEFANERRSLHNFCKLVARFDNNISISRFFITEFWRCD